MSKSIIDRISNGQALHHFGVNPIREDFSATVEITKENGTEFLSMLDEMGFEIIQENDDIYTIKYEYQI